MPTEHSVNVPIGLEESCPPPPTSLVPVVCSGHLGLRGRTLVGLTAGPEVQWVRLSRELCLLGGVDKPVTGGARPCSVGRQLLREPLTPVPHRRFWSLYTLLKLGLALRQRRYIRITNVIFPRRSSFLFFTL